MSACAADGARLTSLFGGNGAAECVWERMGAEEPLEKVMEGESGPTLDLRLPCWDNGLKDSRLIHEPLDERESLTGSPGARVEGSPCFTSEAVLLLFFGGVC